MRRLVFFASLAALAVAGLILGAAPPAHSAGLSAARVKGGEGLEVTRGRGYVVLTNRGTAIGNVARGWIRVANLGGGRAPSGRVHGCERRSGRLTRQLSCAGTGLSFYVYGGTWRIRIKGRGISVSAVMRGKVGLARTGCTSRMFARKRCTFRIGGGPRRRWPATLRFYAVRA